MNSIKKNIEITNKKMEDVEKEVASKAHLKRIRNAFNFVYNRMEKNKKNAYILDIGCRSGMMSGLFQFEGFKNLYGVDVSHKALKTVNSEVKVFLCDAHSLCFSDESFNVVTAAHVVEHCERPQKVVDEVYRVLKDNGLIFIEVPLEHSDRPGAGHFCHFEEQKDVENLMKSFEILESYKDNKYNKDGTEKRRWFRIVGRKCL